MEVPGDYRRPPKASTSRPGPVFTHHKDATIATEKDTKYLNGSEHKEGERLPSRSSIQSHSAVDSNVGNKQVLHPVTSMSSLCSTPPKRNVTTINVTYQDKSPGKRTSISHNPTPSKSNALNLSSLAVDYEQIIPALTCTPDKPIKLTSEVTITKTSKTPHLPAVPTVENSEAKVVHASEDQNQNHVKKKKKKKRRFRNMDAASDEDEPTIPIQQPELQRKQDVSTASSHVMEMSSTQRRMRIVSSSNGPMILGSQSSSSSSSSRSEIPSKPREKIQVLQDVVFTPPEYVGSQHKQKVTSGSVNSQSSSDDSVASIQSKMSAFSNFHVRSFNTSIDSIPDEDIETMASGMAVEGQAPEQEEEDIICGYDEAGNLMCLKKMGEDQFIVIPPEQIVQDGDQIRMINPCEGAEKTVLNDLQSNADLKTSEGADLATPPEPEVIGDVGNEEIIADDVAPSSPSPTDSPDVESDEPMYILNDNEVQPSPLVLAFAETLENLKQAAIVLSPIMSATDAADGENEPPVALAPITTDIDTLMRSQDQCCIVDYEPSDSEDECRIGESMHSVEKLTHMDLTTMVLGEGLSVQLVSDQAQAVDLLQLPPDYKPNPVVLRPVVPVNVSPLLQDIVTSTPKSAKKVIKKKKKSVSPKKLVSSPPKKLMKGTPKAISNKMTPINATSTKSTPASTGSGVAKGHKRPMQHVTGDLGYPSPPKMQCQFETIQVAQTSTPVKKLKVLLPVKKIKTLLPVVHSGKPQSPIKSPSAAKKKNSDPPATNVSGIPTNPQLESSQSEPDLSPLFGNEPKKVATVKKKKKAPLLHKQRYVKRKQEANRKKLLESTQQGGDTEETLKMNADAKDETSNNLPHSSIDTSTRGNDDVAPNENHAAMTTVSSGAQVSPALHLDTESPSTDHTSSNAKANNVTMKVALAISSKHNPTEDQSAKRITRSTKNTTVVMDAEQFRDAAICISLPSQAEHQTGTHEDVVHVETKQTNDTDTQPSASAHVDNNNGDAKSNENATPEIRRASICETERVPFRVLLETLSPPPTDKLREVQSPFKSPMLSPNFKIPKKPNKSPSSSPQSALTLNSRNRDKKKSSKKSKKSKRSKSDRVHPHSSASSDSDHYGEPPPLRLEAAHESPKVPKITIKLPKSPESSPIIVPTPPPLQVTPKMHAAISNSSRRLQFAETTPPKSPGKSDKRKVLSPLSLISNEIKYSPHEKRSKHDENGKIDDQLATFDPEIVINIKTDPVIEDIPEAKSPPPIDDTYKVGDLAMARLGSFSYWPCMITTEPLHQSHCRITPAASIFFHVRFFGDNGRRAWVPKTNVIPYRGPNTLELHRAELEQKFTSIVVKKLRDYKSCKIAKTKLSPWEHGMEEAAAMVDKTVDERHDFFFRMFATQREKQQLAAKLKRKRSSTTSNEASSPSPNEAGGMVPKEIHDNPQPNKKQKVAPTTPKSKPKKLSETKKKKSVDACTPPKKNYVFEDLEMILKGIDPDTEIKQEQDADEPIAEKSKNQKPKGSKKNRKSEQQPDAAPVRNKLPGDLASEYSDTDSSSRLSTQSTQVSKRALFRDVPRTAVCQVCFKSDDVVLKCKGPCCGSFHAHCVPAGLILTEDIKLEPLSNPSSGRASPINGVEIVDVQTKTQYFDSAEVNLNNSDLNISQTDLMAKLELKLSKVMEPIASTTLYCGSSTEDSAEEDVKPSTETLNEIRAVAEAQFVCNLCKTNKIPVCFSCNGEVYFGEELRYLCSVAGCGRYFHKGCLKRWPHAQIDVVQPSAGAFNYKCPMHNCQTCNSNNPKACTTITPLTKLVRCVKCPGTYHTDSFCIPAGSEILSATQMICPRHVDHKSKRYTVNANWCFICSRGGNLTCCETCPTSVHAECIHVNLLPDDTFVCEDCESGRLPLYDEIVWVKLGAYKWWPAVALFPEDIPSNLLAHPHRSGEFVVRFYGTHDHQWIGIGRVFVFQEDDNREGNKKKASSGKDAQLQHAIAEARAANEVKSAIQKQRSLARQANSKPAPYVKIKVNRMASNLRVHDGNVSNTQACNCDTYMEEPCGPYADCLNRILLTECDPGICPAKDKCNNQRFEKRQYAPVKVHRTEGRGWGLICTEPLKQGQFVIEYVGDVIDQAEYQRRITEMKNQKAENYYFLTLDVGRTIDAGPRGNLARFMNHSCAPNCETQKWTVNGDTRVGLFALEDVPANTELTFNYNMETIGTEKTICHCGTDACSGYLGVKKEKDSNKSTQKSKKKSLPAVRVESPAPKPCFICDAPETDVNCTMKNCGKCYHMKCLEITSVPNKWTCPRHFCNVCAKRTCRSCLRCLESYCPMHAFGTIAFVKKIGYLCSKHKPDTQEGGATAQSPTAQDNQEDDISIAESDAS